MKFHAVWIISWMAIWIGISDSVASQTTTDSNQLKQILKDAAQYGLSVNGQKELDLSIVCPGKQMQIRYDGLVVTELGVKLIPQEIRQPALTPVVYDFVERYLLALLLKGGKKEQIKRLREDFCRLVIDGKELKDSPYSIQKVLQQIQFDTPMGIQNDSLLFTFRWNFREGKPSKMEFIFPKQYDLMMGKDKKELAPYYQRLLSNFSGLPTKDSIAWPSGSYQSDKGIYSWLGDIYLIPQVKSGAHFVEKGSSLHFLLNERFGEESLLNLFGYADQMQYSNPMEIEVIGYRYRETVVCPMDKLTAFMRSQHYRVYMGLEEWNQEEFIGTAFYLNRDLMCKHMLYFHFPRAAFKQKDVVIHAKLYPFIPIQNIGTLYDKDTEKEVNREIPVKR